METNSFTSNAMSLADYGMESLVYELNHAAARLARDAADEWERRTPDTPRFVAGVLGPTNRSASLSPDVNDPGFRNVTFDQLVATYTEGARGLVDGGRGPASRRDHLRHPQREGGDLRDRGAVRPARLPAAGHDLGHDRRRERPDALRARPPRRSGIRWRTRGPLSVGLNCALGAVQALRQYVQELSRVAPVYVSAHPNAGLPNEFGQYDDTPEHMAEVLREFAEHGLVNFVGRLLRDDAGAHPRDRRRGARPRAAGAATPGAEAPSQRARAAHDRARQHLRERGRADQRDRVAEVRAARFSPATTRPASRSRASRWRAARR